MPLPGVSFPSSLSGTNAAKVYNPVLQDYIFNAGLVMPEVSSILTEIYP